MNETKVDKPKSSKNAAAAGSQHAGRVLSLKPGKRGLEIAPDLKLEWKGEADRKNLPTAAGENVAGIGCIRIQTGKAEGWVRLCCEPERREDAGLLGVRMLVKFSKKTAQKASLRVLLAETDETTGRREGISSSYQNIDCELDVWQEIRGLFACAAPDAGKRIDVMINLPSNYEIMLAAIDCRWLDATFSATRREKLDQNRVERISRIHQQALEEGEVRSALRSGCFGASVFLRGLSAWGWALPVTPETGVVALLEGDRVKLALDKEVEISDGITLGMGFSYGLGAVAKKGVKEVSFALETATDRPFGRVKVPMIRARDGKRGQDAPGAERGIELLFFPDYTATNPYQSLMYGHLDGVKYSAGDVDSALDRLRDPSNSAKVVFHLHWLNPILAGAKTVAQAEAKRIAFRDKLSFFVSLGGVVLWTVHNVVSHDAKFRETERALGQDVADLAVGIHVHSERLLPILAADYDLPPEKLLIQPHPNYIGYYPGYVGREEARARLSLEPNAKVFLFFGQLRPYKGIDRLVKCFSELQRTNPDIHLLIVGNPVHPYGKGELKQKYEGFRNVRVIEGQIADASLQWYYKASDWVVLPYNNILTSGSLLLAMSFARPCIAPRMGMIPDVLRDNENGFSYDPEDPDGLMKAMKRAVASAPDQEQGFGAEAMRTVEPLTWKEMSGALLATIKKHYDFQHVTLAFEDGARDCLLMGRRFPPRKIARTAVIILNYEHLDDVLRLAGSLRNSTNTDYDLYVVDNCSPSLTEYDLYARLSDVHVLRMPENLGYAAGNNAAMRLIADLDYEFIWILNPDMVVSPVALEQHLRAAEVHPDTAVFGPVILPGGDNDRVASAGCMISLENGVSTQHMYAGEPLSALPDKPYKADFVTGASVFLRKAALDTIGHIPEDYFLYFEETQWLVEAGRKGVKCLVLPHIRLSHHKRSEEGGLPAKYYFYYFLRNSIIFAHRLARQNPNSTINRLRAGFISAWLKKIAARAPKKPDFYEALVERALDDGVKGKTGRIDLIELEISLQKKLVPTPVNLLRLDLMVTDDNALSGIVEFGLPLPETCLVSVICGDEIIAHEQIDPVAAEPQTFSVALPEEHKDGRKRTYHLYANGRKVEGTQVHALLPVPEPYYTGRIDGIRQFCCQGWACNKSDMRHPVRVEILHQGEVIARGEAGEYRSDLARHNLRNGYAAFNLRLPKRFSDGRDHELSLRIEGEEEILFKRSFRDDVISGGERPRAPLVALQQLFYTRQYWLAQHDFEDLPIGRHMNLAEQSLLRKHGRGDQSVKVSVIMPMFNRANSVLEAIGSVRAQSFTNWELLVVDDGSTDDSVETVSRLISETGDGRIRIIRLPANRGVSAARNAGLREAEGEIIAYLDSDNVWRPDFLTVMAGELTSQPEETAAAYCGQRIMHVCGLPENPVEELIAIRIGAFHMALLENRNFIDLNCYVHRRSMFEKHGGFNEAMRRLVDWELILRYSMQSPPHFVPALLSSYFFDKADNQITKSENYPLSLERLKQSMERAKAQKAQKIQSVEDALRPVEVVLIATGKGDAEKIAARISDIEATMPSATQCELIAYVTEENMEAVAGMTSDAVSLREAASDVAALADALEARRAEADLAVLCNNALPAQGWLQGFNRAIGCSGGAGMLISRNTLRGNAANARAHAPFASRDLDVCIALSARRNNVLDPAYNTRENLVSVSGFEPFCTYILRECASEMALQETDGLSLQDAFGELADFARAYLNRDIVYAGDVQAFNLQSTG